MNRHLTRYNFSCFAQSLISPRSKSPQCSISCCSPSTKPSYFSLIGRIVLTVLLLAQKCLKLLLTTPTSSDLLLNLLTCYLEEFRAVVTRVVSIRVLESTCLSSASIRPSLGTADTIPLLPDFHKPRIPLLDSLEMPRMMTRKVKATRVERDEVANPDLSDSILKILTMVLVTNWTRQMMLSMMIPLVVVVVVAAVEVR